MILPIANFAFSDETIAISVCKIIIIIEWAPLYAIKVKGIIWLMASN
jgi:hypothetical protein